jgi:hypothetical protein
LGRTSTGWIAPALPGALIPSTKADDGDPLDVLIIHDAATYPGLVLRCTPVGVLEVEQSSKGKQERNDRVFVVPDRSPFEGDLQDIRRLPARAVKELEEFFLATNALEAKTLKFLGWRGPGEGHQDHQEDVNLSGHDAGRRPPAPKPRNRHTEAKAKAAWVRKFGMLGGSTGASISPMPIL